MFELSHLTRSRNQLWSDLLTNLEGSGSNLALSEAELIAAARNTYGGSISAKTTSRAALIASLVNAAGGNVSERTHSEGQMLAALATALGGTASALSNSFEESLSIAVDETSGGGGGGDYTAQAVNFDGETYLSIASLTSTDGNDFGFSFWFKSDTPVLDPFSPTLFAVGDPNTTGIISTSIIGPSAAIGRPDEPVVEVGLWSDDAEDSLYVEDDGTQPPFNNQWHHALFAMNTSSRTAKLYLDDVDVSSATELSFGTGPFVAGFDGKPMMCFFDTFGAFIGDIADFWLAPNQNLLTAGDISEATRRKFISANGKPVNLGANGETPTGTAPRVFFKRDGAASTFATNRGTGGAFTLTGTLTNASTSPSD